MSDAEFIKPSSDPVFKEPSGWQERVPEDWDWQTLWEAIEVGNHTYTDEFVRKAIDAEINPKVILDDGLFPGFDLQGDRFSAQIIFIPEMLITARAMKTGLALIRPLLAAMAEKPVGTFVMGTVLGDMHDIGQSIVTIMLENAGFKMINLGTDIHPDRFIEAAEKEKAIIRFKKINGQMQDTAKVNTIKKNVAKLLTTLNNNNKNKNEQKNTKR